MDWETLKWGFSKTSILLGLSIIDHLFLGTPIYGKIQMRKKLGRLRSCAGIISLRAEAFYYTVFDLQAQQAPAAGRFLLCWATRSLDKFMGNPVFLQFCLQQVWICTSWIPETHLKIFTSHWEGEIHWQTHRSKLFTSWNRMDTRHHFRPFQALILIMPSTKSIKTGFYETIILLVLSRKWGNDP
jgi:hypothetical protein